LPRGVHPHPVDPVRQFGCASSAATSSTAASTAFRKLSFLTLTRPLVLLMELRTRRYEAVTDVIERLA
jgi:hypothetical protein